MLSTRERMPRKIHNAPKAGKVSRTARKKAVAAVVADIKDRSPNQDLIDQLESMLGKAKEGKIRTMIAVYGWDDDFWTHGWAIDNRTTRRRMLGEMSMVNYELLTNTALEDGNTILSKAFNMD